MMEQRDDLRNQDPASPRLSTMNDEITKATSDHKRRQWREFVETVMADTHNIPKGKMILVWPLQSGNYVSHVIRNTQTSLTEMNHVN